MKKTLLALVLLAAPLGAQRWPVEPAPEAFHGPRMKPGPSRASVFIDRTAACNSCDSDDEPSAFDIDILGDRLFVGAGPGPCVYDLTQPMRPAKIACSLGRGQNLPAGVRYGDSDGDIYVLRTAATTRDLFVTSFKEVGFVTWGVRGSSLVMHYQNAGRHVDDVDTMEVGGKHYGLALDTTGHGIALYDLDKAAELLSGCVDTGGAGTCGVLAGFLEVEGGNLVSMAVYEDLIAVRLGGTDLQVFRVNVDDFARSDLVMSEQLPGTTAGDVDLFRQGGKLWLVALTARFAGGKNSSSLNVYDATCLDRQPACALPAPSVVYDAPDGLTAASRQEFLTVSEVGEKTYLSVGNPNANRGTCQDQRTHLLDVTDFDPSKTLAELDLMPPRYGRWYFPECGGFRGLVPYGYKVGPGDIAYRFANRVADTHRILPAVEVDTGEIFSDGFETGTTERWAR